MNIQINQVYKTRNGEKVVIIEVPTNTSLEKYDILVQRLTGGKKLHIM